MFMLLFSVLAGCLKVPAPALQGAEFAPLAFLAQWLG
jgi:hypothetical protein